MERWVRQGVTTIVAGNCGFSPAPIYPETRDAVENYWNFAFPSDGLSFEWSSMAEYFDHMKRNGLAYNVAVLTGHNVLRMNLLGMRERARLRSGEVQFQGRPGQGTTVTVRLPLSTNN